MRVRAWRRREGLDEARSFKEGREEGEDLVKDCERLLVGGEEFVSRVSVENLVDFEVVASFDDRVCEWILVVVAEGMVMRLDFSRRRGSAVAVAHLVCDANVPRISCPGSCQKSLFEIVVVRRSMTAIWVSAGSQQACGLQICLGLFCRSQCWLVLSFWEYTRMSKTTR